MRGIKRDITGQRFKRLVAVRRTGTRPDGDSNWEVLCDCGGTAILRLGHITSGDAASCGKCSPHKNNKPPVRTTHGLRHLTEYNIWLGIKQRTRNPDDGDYPNYGGRGITMADEFFDSFAVWFAHVGHRPSLKHSIDRIDNNQGYVPGNMRWATAKEQRANQRPRRQRAAPAPNASELAHWDAQEAQYLAGEASL